MEKPEDHGGSKEDNKCCKYCCKEDGTLKSKEEAEKSVNEAMSKMPAWKE